MTCKWELGIENLPKEELGIDLYLELEGGEVMALRLSQLSHSQALA